MEVLPRLGYSVADSADEVMAAQFGSVGPQAPLRSAGSRKKKLLIGLVAVVVIAAIAGIGVFLMIGRHTDPAAQQARDEAAIESVLRSVLEAEHPNVVMKLFSSELQERYKRAQLPATLDRSDQGKVLYVSDYLIGGDSANADVTFRYPDLRESTITFALVREGGQWRFAG
ncbi:hypothetical protein ACFXG4_36150 [Nocardia sp. NPDC059246]|uniref:Rv0361 family membrane protein n=1 Tax=unclassified Nocardia TaxID=2637762 RepID=UPI0036C8F66A